MPSRTEEGSAEERQVTVVPDFEHPVEVELSVAQSVEATVAAVEDARSEIATYVPAGSVASSFHVVPPIKFAVFPVSNFDEVRVCPDG